MRDEDQAYRDALDGLRHGAEAPSPIAEALSFFGLTDPPPRPNIDPPPTTGPNSRKADPLPGAGPPKSRREPPITVLDPESPYRTAQLLAERYFMSGRHRLLLRSQGSVYAYDAGHFTEVPDDVLRSRVYGMLAGYQDPDGDDFQPNRTKVADVLDALAACSQVADDPINPPCWLTPTELPADQMLPCRNGLLDLTTRELIPHTPAFFSLSPAGYAYAVDAEAPGAWLKFLGELWPNDPDSIATLQEVFGLLLTNSTKFQKIPMLVGQRRSGKGTIARILTALRGTGSVVAPSLESLSQNFGLEPLIGKALAIVSDARLTNRSDPQSITERLLKISGEDGVTIARKYKSAWTGRLPTRFLLLANKLPKLTDPSGALASRFVILVLTQSFLGREDLELEGRLMTELPGILLWALEGRDRLFARGSFTQPAASAEFAEAMADLASPTAAFIRDCCIVAADQTVGVQALFNEWRNWRHDRGHKESREEAFGADLRSVVGGLSRHRTPRTPGMPRTWEYHGIGLDPERSHPFGHVSL